MIKTDGRTDGGQNTDAHTKQRKELEKERKEKKKERTNGNSQESEVYKAEEKKKNIK
jgi:hypothetical protein